MAPLVGEITAAGWVVRHVDVDREGDLVRRFAVTGVPCYVLLVKGHEAGRINGATTRGELENLLAKSRQPLGLAAAAAAPAATSMAGIPLPVTPAGAPLSTEPPAAPQVASAAILTAGAPAASRPDRLAATPRPRQPATLPAADAVANHAAGRDTAAAHGLHRPSARPGFPGRVAGHRHRDRLPAG
jgi:hypothetical protein